MPQRWFCRVLSDEFGPLTSRQLARLVWEEMVAKGNEVRPDYLRHWQSAESVVGLHYMAFWAPGGTEDPEADVVAGVLPGGVAVMYSTLPTTFVEEGPAPDLDDVENPFEVDKESTSQPLLS